jgi:hypothetical protein
MNAETFPQYEGAGSEADCLATLIPAADVSSISYCGVSISNNQDPTGDDVDQIIAVLAPTGLTDPVLAAQETTMKAGGAAIVSLKGNVLTLSSSTGNNAFALPVPELTSEHC